jgi:hypothetical protein
MAIASPRNNNIMKKPAKPTMLKKVGPITLGLTYTDAVHGIKGVATCYATHLTGCNRVALEWVDKDGQPKEMWIDETRLLDENGEYVIKPKDRVDGPGKDPTPRGIK